MFFTLVINADLPSVGSMYTVAAVVLLQMSLHVFANENSTRMSNYSFLQRRKDSAWCKKWDWLCTCVLVLCWMKWQLLLLVGIIKDEMIFQVFGKTCSDSSFYWYPVWQPGMWLTEVMCSWAPSWSQLHLCGGKICHIIINILKTRSLSWSGNSWRLLVPLSGGRSMV